MVSVLVTGDSVEVDSVPHCKWPLNVLGNPSAAQAGLVRCYVKALARASLNDLLPLMDAPGGFPMRIGPADLSHATDAASGTATATFETSAMTPFAATVDIKFATGARTSLGMDARNVDEPASHSWRLDIGVPVDEPSGPPPAQPP